MKEGSGPDRRATEQAVNALGRQLEKYPWYDITRCGAGGLCCICITYGDHVPETQPPYSMESIKAFIEEEEVRSYRRLSEQYGDRAQNKVRD